jgi:2-polyprenyl-3-methyl-5-hydroxy-6-metoxy-1,4-benzoquinol methylase
MDRPSILSKEYRDLNAELHRRDATYGTTGRRHLDLVRRLAEKYRARQILDYGCGKRDLWHALHHEFDVRNFDPALPEFELPPEPADLVTCIDVLEHVEPEFLDNVLSDLVRVTVKAALLTIATRPALKRLPDGTNCHRLIQPSSWWTNCLKQRFHVASVQSAPSDNGLLLVLESSRYHTTPHDS